MSHRMPIPRQSGFSLMAAIFLLLVLAALGAYMVKISGVQQVSVSDAIQGVRAYQAARAGIEWGVASAVSSGNCPASPNTFNVPEGGGFSYAVTVTCNSTSHQERSTTYNVYVFQSISRSLAPGFGQPGYSSRTIIASATDTNAP